MTGGNSAYWQFNYDAPLSEKKTFSTAVHRASNIIKNKVTIFEASDARLLDALCDVNTEGKMMSDRSTRNMFGEKTPLDPEHRN